VSKQTLVVRNATVADYIEKALLEGKGVEEILMRFKNSVIVHALTLREGNVSQAAVLLKTHRNNLVRWIHENRLSEQFNTEEET
jgi:DNA-binding NtrC family response regulator